MEIWIDNRYFLVKDIYTIFQYCAKKGINLPCFCYHERLTIAGNCRICVVEANSSLVVSCATMLIDKMKIFTKNKRINKSREATLEFLLINHPLDCPICDQGGECDLQDISLTYGSDRGRYYDNNKRVVNNLNCFGSLIKTVMTRCIHCTRCVRFLEEISSIKDFGVIGRGKNMEIGTYILNIIDDELMGNIIDLCPVGALISMTSSFVGRNWELKYIQSIDIFDSIATVIRIGVANNSVMRIMPCLDEYNDEWITNKARFLYDSFNIQRISYPKLKLYKKFIIISWKIALILFFHLLKKQSKNFIEIYCGYYLSLDNCYSLKYFFTNLGCFNIYYLNIDNNISDFRYSYLLNNTLKNLNNMLDIFIIGGNLRLEIPLLNANIRKNYIQNMNLKVYSIGLALDYLTYPVINLGSSIKNLLKFILGLMLVNKFLLFNDFYNNYYINNKNLLFIYFFIGSSTQIRNDYNSILNKILYFFHKLKLNINKLNIISRDLGRISLFEINLLQKINNKSIFIKKKSFNFILGLDNLLFNIKNKLNINVYEGYFFMSNIFEYVNLILPTTIYVEERSYYLNLEGRLRFTNKAISQFKNIYTNIKIMKALFILTNIYINNNFSIMKNLKKNIKKFKFFYIFNLLYLYKLKLNNIVVNKELFNFNLYKLKLNNSLFTTILFNYYNNDNFALNSKSFSIMSQKISKHIFKNNYNY